MESRNTNKCLWVPVTTCGRAADALSLLREDISKFDLVISDVYMPDMDGFKLLELVGLEMDLPVISKCLLFHLLFAARIAADYPINSRILSLTNQSLCLWM